jgi:hypothetical protein
MTRVQPHSAGFALGILLGAWHALWAVLVWAGAAQPVIDFIFQLHMITPPYKIAAFDPGLALALVLVTAIIGYVFGWAGAAIWNRYGFVAEPRIASSRS